MRTVAVFTGTRAEYGLLKPLMDEIVADPDLTLRILASGMHLSPEFGLTVHDMEKDGLTIDEKVEVLLSSDTPVGVCKSMGLGLIGFAEALERMSPDIMVVLGDRFEAFAAATAAMVCRTPLAHIHGGEATYGAHDESLRHGITKLSQLHFTSTEEYRRRVVQLGEDPARVFNVGAIGIENIRRLILLSREGLEKELNFRLGKQSAIVTFHPVTLEAGTTKDYCGRMLEALDRFPELRVIFTKANADTEGRVINSMLDDYQAVNPDRCRVFTSLGQLRYLSALRHADLCLGNSSSGIVEAPSMKTPTVNIGNRQAGRTRADSVIDCRPTVDDIAAALEKALSPEFQDLARNVKNPYEKPDTAATIKGVIKDFNLSGILIKRFFDIDFKL